MKTTSFTEASGFKPFDWHHALDNIGEYDYEDLINLSRKWVTCACGKQCNSIPRDHIGKPFDEVLSCLGTEFFCQIHAEDWEDAKETLIRIEKRSIHLIKEINK